jgi:hypothetical protein
MRGKEVKGYSYSAEPGETRSRRLGAQPRLCASDRYRKPEAFDLAAERSDALEPGGPRVACRGNLKALQ